MKRDHRHALALVLGDLGSATIANAVFLNADVLPETGSGVKDGLHCEQEFRPTYLRLQNAGYRVTPHEQGAGFSAALLLAGRSRRLNEQRLARAWNACKPGSPVIVAGMKTDGIASLRRYAARHAPIMDSFAKFHSTVFRLETTEAEWPVADLSLNIAGYELTEGMFAADGPDSGSKLLAECIDTRVRGTVFDLGAGWGFLSREALRRSDRIDLVELFEADFHALNAARANLAGHENAKFHWCDVPGEFKPRPADWVIMNPPFHDGRKASPAIGQAFIACAAATLPVGGRLLMVANRHLPYEMTLQEHFRLHETIRQESGFKVIEARR